MRQFVHLVRLQIDNATFPGMSQSVIDTFYSAFASHDVEAMLACYHPEVTFEDPAFGRLDAARSNAMWRMLLSSSDAQLEVHYSDIAVQGNNGQARWVARYFFGPQRRPVINEVKASFTLRDDKIYTHTDSFDLWRWSRQALGLAGTLLGWSPYMRRKIQQTTNKRHDRFMKKDLA